MCVDGSVDDNGGIDGCIDEGFVEFNGNGGIDKELFDD